MRDQNEFINEKDKDNRILIIWGLVTVIGLFFYFFFIHPIYIYDSDDWTYISYSRQIFPSTNQWNPTKILPEILMPFVSAIAVRLLYPISGDYIGSLAAGFALTMAVFIVVISYIFLLLLKDKFEINNPTILLIGAILTLSYWLPYNIVDRNNRFLFYGGNANCYFNYIIPAIFNGIAVLIYLDNSFKNKRCDKEHWISTGAIILFLYLCINSNMFHSIILISFIGARLLIDLVKSVIVAHKKYTFLDFIRNNIYDIVIISCWLISIIFESKGARAQWAANTTLFNLPIKTTLVYFIDSLHFLNKIWIVSIIIVIMGGLILLIINSKTMDECDRVYFNILRELGLALLITFVYLILLCSKVSSNYISNNTVMISWMLLVIYIAFFSLAYILKRVNALAIGLPFFLLFITFNTFIDGHTFAENNVVWNYNIDTVKKLDEYYIEQIVAADEAGLDCIEIMVPVSDSNTWPLDYSYAGDRIAISLYRHGIIKSQLHVVMIPDNSVNEEFYLPTATMP